MSQDFQDCKIDDSRYERKAFSLLCPICGGNIARAHVDENPNILQWRCNQCHEEFGPPWNKLLLGDKPRTKLVGPKPWPRAKRLTVLQLAHALITYVLSYAVALMGLLL